jgi:hypothetical protein
MLSASCIRTLLLIFPNLSLLSLLLLQGRATLPRLAGNRHT